MHTAVSISGDDEAELVVAFNTYFQEELSFLREQGREFAVANPELAALLNEAGADPDVERLLEGVAFLTGRIRQKLDDDLPEFSQALVQLLWPHYLRSTPAITIMQATPAEQASAGARELAAGICIDSLPVDGCRCRFTTGDRCQVLPLRVTDATLQRDRRVTLRLRLAMTAAGSLGELGCDRLRFYLDGESAISRGWYMVLCQSLRQVRVRVGDETVPRSTPLTVGPVGWTAEERLLAEPGTPGDGLTCLWEWFACPERFLFVDVSGFGCLADGGEATHCELIFECDEIPDDLSVLPASGWCLNCVPAVNCFERDGEPIRVDARRHEYRIRPADDPAGHFQVHRLQRLVGMERGANQAVDLVPLAHVAPYARSDDRAYYEVVQRPALVGDGHDAYVRLVSGGPHYETLSVDLVVSNGTLASGIGIGDIATATANCPAHVAWRNRIRPSGSVPPPMGEDMLWRLLGHSALDVRSLAEVDALRSLIELYDFRARVDRGAQMSLRLLLDGLRQVQLRPATRLQGGVPVRGVTIEVVVDEQAFPSLGSLFLFGCALDGVFAEAVSLNAFSQLVLCGLRQGRRWSFPLRIGRRHLL